MNFLSISLSQTSNTKALRRGVAELCNPLRQRQEERVRGVWFWMLFYCILKITLLCATLTHCPTSCHRPPLNTCFPSFWPRCYGNRRHFFRQVCRAAGHVMPAETLIATTSAWHLRPTRATMSPTCSSAFFFSACSCFSLFSSFVSSAHVFVP